MSLLLESAPEIESTFDTAPSSAGVYRPEVFVTNLPIGSIKQAPRGTTKKALSLSTRCYVMTKRCLDVLGSLFAILILSPVMGVTAFFIKVTDWGPIFYSQDRVGLDGRVFRCIKFRSMVPNADRIWVDLAGQNAHTDSRTFKIPNDPRVTWIGRLIRISSIDELPQLFNVFVGDMSLVGPRPALPSEVAQYSSSDRRRLEVKPGITCIWQVSGRSRLPFPEQLRLDIEYIENRCLLLDMKLLALTLPAVISADGAY